MEKNDKLKLIREKISDKTTSSGCHILYKWEEFIILKRIFLKDNDFVFFVTWVDNMQNIMTSILAFDKYTVIWHWLKKEDLEKYIVQNNSSKKEVLIKWLNRIWDYEKNFDSQKEKIFDFAISCFK